MTSTLQALYSAVPGSLSTDIPTPFVDSFDAYTRTPKKSRGTLRPAQLPMAIRSWYLQEDYLYAGRLRRPDEYKPMGTLSMACKRRAP